ARSDNRSNFPVANKLFASHHSRTSAPPTDPIQTCTHHRWPTNPDRLDTRRTTAAPSENLAPKSLSPARRCKASMNIADPEPCESLQSKLHRIPTALAVAHRALACAKSNLPTPASDGKDPAAPSAQNRRRRDSSK